MSNHSSRGATAGLLSSSWNLRSDRKSTRLNSSHTVISYAVFCLKKKREGLTMAWETTYRLPGLSLPDPRHLPPTLERLTQYEAVRLFSDRATAALPSLKVTNENA